MDVKKSSTSIFFGILLFLARLGPMLVKYSQNLFAMLSASVTFSLFINK